MFVVLMPNPLFKEELPINEMASPFSVFALVQRRWSLRMFAIQMSKGCNFSVPVVERPHG